MTMDSFLDLFNPSWEDESPNEDCNGNVLSEIENVNSIIKKHPTCNVSQEGKRDVNLPDQLPSEPQEGNIEYKLKLLNPNNERFKRLVSQVFFHFF